MLILNLHATMLYALFIGPVIRCELLENLFAHPLFNVINGWIVYIFLIEAKKERSWMNYALHLFSFRLLKLVVFMVNIIDKLNICYF